MPPTGHSAAHPFLKGSILYIVNPPSHLKWEQIQAALTGNGCGKVENVGHGTVAGQNKWGVRFMNTYYAEMALATMQGAVVEELVPPWTVTLSHSPTLTSDTTSIPIFPQYLQTKASFFKGVTAQLLFRYFRNAGPLVSVRMNVNIGNKQHTAVLEYWKAEHANTARLLKNSVHGQLKACPAISLRTYDPCSLRCAGFEHFFPQKSLIDAFSKFGTIINASLYFGQNGTYGIITFASSDSATRALQELDGKALGGSLIAVSYEEPMAQDVFHRSPSQSNDSTNRSRTSTADTPRAGPSAEQLRREALMRELKESTERQVREASAREAAEAKVKRRQEQLLCRAQAESVHARAKEELEAAMAKRRCACKGVVLAKQAQETADQELAEAEDACAEAKRIWLEAMDRKAKAEQQATTARKITSEALRWRENIGATVDAAKQEEKASRTKKEKLAHELAEDELDEETLRLAELAESIRRMQELRMLDLAEEKEKARKEQAAEEQMKREKDAAEEKSKLEREETARREREETARREREEAARREGEEAARLEREEAARRERKEAEQLAQEKLEREEQARHDAETRKRRYEQAVRAEQLRCRMGDLEFCRSSTADQWSEQRALERFKFFSDDFDTIKFQELQPLTFESVPWPILAQPRDMNFDAIDWSAVEKFFNAMEKLMPDKTEYKTFIAKAHRRFHPDKWKARGILNSVLDDGFRAQLETAGNVVAQAITPLWLKSRQL